MTTHTLAALVCAVLLAGCNQPPGPDNSPAAPLTSDEPGCAPGPQVVTALKLLIVVDASPSMAVTDPLGTRIKAVTDLLGELPDSPQISFAVLAFSGTTSAWLTKDHTPQFDALIDYRPEDKDLLARGILGVTDPSAPATRDFVAPLADAYQLISHDIVNEQHSLMSTRTQTHYSVIFISDGAPSQNQDVDLLCGEFVSRFGQLTALTAGVEVNTVHVFGPNVTSLVCDHAQGLVNPPMEVCGLPALTAQACPDQLVDQNALRLQHMAQLGGGAFRDFRHDQAVSLHGLSGIVDAVDALSAGADAGCASEPTP